ncbi:hypothetical protein MJO28_005424 [Puccinia striiformis f. sp. tritici]|uniref:Uncharacterized protein n=1 Tax=Puccinia striiformis f. sp. tritici TaxID=168172 RepID=A0ACC0ELE8_9BASI|nr:hypothetical protein Pst134EA_009583 [Puccinia striiformis f. sp. tritici]KAH9469060.1 hypothetical protein Pst134EA_009583 [Puccinia striiformis f. sp. tritici]KAI7955024.1 hypothetical protein MJO28_005424 [Puccinia striiformis f. sp. tritici]KAI7960403.1 hypothetical protein MJO29_005471 [Puccinia striiformis f. sp. tritici]KAI9621455.1 hypothetical protein H4Q26_015758 [Puccinia striiformis f. sp. tritici PST-130]
MEINQLIRSYAAHSPPTIPHPTWLAQLNNQIILFDLLSQYSDHQAGRTWKLRFWKRIITVIEREFKRDPVLYQEEEIDERILNYYISLQHQQQPDKTIEEIELHIYYYGPINERDSWSKINLYENKASISQGTTGLRSWGASVCLSNYLILNQEDILRSTPDNQSQTTTIIELGSGTGLLGLLAYQLNPRNRVILSDFNQHVIDRLRSNLDLNFKEDERRNISVVNVDWNDHSKAGICHDEDWNGRTIVLGSDLVYDPDLVPGLVTTIKHTLKPQHCSSSGGGSQSFGLICGTVRAPETWDLFISTCGEQGLDVEYLDVQKAIEYGNPNSDGIIFPQSLDQSIDKLKLVKLSISD